VLHGGIVRKQAPKADRVSCGAVRGSQIPGLTHIVRDKYSPLLGTKRICFRERVSLSFLVTSANGRNSLTLCK
jgi:hypothetical protein